MFERTTCLALSQENTIDSSQSDMLVKETGDTNGCVLQQNQDGSLLEVTPGGCVLEENSGSCVLVEVLGCVLEKNPVCSAGAFSVLHRLHECLSSS